MDTNGILANRWDQSTDQKKKNPESTSIKKKNCFKNNLKSPILPNIFLFVSDNEFNQILKISLPSLLPFLHPFCIPVS